MTDKPHTPTVDELRKLYLLKVPHDQRERRSAEFDRFLTAAEQRGAARALRALAHSLTAGRDPETDTRIFDPWDVAEILLARADRIANKENDGQI